MVLFDQRDSTTYAALNLGHFGVKLHRSSDEGKNWEECAGPHSPGNLLLHFLGESLQQGLAAIRFNKFGLSRPEEPASHACYGLEPSQGDFFVPRIAALPGSWYKLCG